MKCKTFSFLVTTFIIGILLVQGVYAFDGDDVSVSPDFISTCPSRTLSNDDISLFVTNTGPTTDTFFMEIEWLPGLSFIQPQVTLASGEMRKIEPLWITIPYDVEPGSLFATVTAESALTGDMVSKSIEVNILNCHVIELEVSPLERTQQICKEEEVPLEFTIEATNMGMDTETFVLSTDEPWAELDTDSVTLDTGEAVTFTLVVDPPESVSDFQTITITAQSTSSFAHAEVKVFVDVIDCYDFTARIQPSSATVCLGKEADFTLLISNTGLDDSFRIMGDDSVSLSAESISLASNEARQIGFSLKPNNIGSNPFEITVQSDKDVGNSKTVSGVITGEECKGVSVIISPAQANACSGDTVGYIVNIQNTGSLTDSFDLTTSHGTLDHTGVTLDSDESMDVALTVDTADIDGEVTIEVSAASGSVSDTSAANLNVRTCYGGSLEIIPSAISACPFTDVEFEIIIENTGEMTDEYVISFADTEETVELDAAD